MSSMDLGRYKRIVQYFWDPEPKNEKASPIWCLGKEYIPLAADLPDTSSISQSTPALSTEKSELTPEDSLSNSVDDGLAYQEPDQAGDGSNGWPAPFLDDIESRLWLTYRSNFAPIHRSLDPKASAVMSIGVRLRSQLIDQEGYTSDTGWGCMIRSGQSVLANTILISKLGRAWRRGQALDEEKRILALFADDPKAPFSIHEFVRHGAEACGKHPGQWFGPSATAQCIAALSTKNQESSGLRVYVTGDGSDVYEDVFMRIAKSSSTTIQPTLILIGTRLGIERVTPAYWEALKSSLEMPQSMGIAGGRPSASHYFVGIQDSSFFYLDPHHTRPALRLPSNPLDISDEDVESYHTRRLRMLDIKEMDPSMLIAFLIRDEEDWQDWKKGISNGSGKAVIRVADTEGDLRGRGTEREGALDEVEAFDEDEDNE